MSQSQEVRSLDEALGRTSSSRRSPLVSAEAPGTQRLGTLPSALGGLQNSKVRSSSHHLEYQRSKEAQQLAEGVNPDDEQIEGLVEKGIGRRDERSLPQRILANMGRFCLSGRTERAFRFAFCVPLALLISYDESLVKSRFSHLAVVVYTIMAALLPPSFSFISLIWFMAIPAVLIGCGAMTLGWVFDSQIYENGWSESKVNAYTLATMTLVFLVASNTRIGTLAPLLTIAFYCIIYVAQYSLIQSSQIIRHGVTIFLSKEWIQATAGGGLQNLIQSMPEPLRSLMRALEGIIERLLALLPVKSIDRYIPIPKQITEMGYKGLDRLVGVPVHFWGSTDSGLNINVPGGYHMLRTGWEGQHEVGMVWGAVNYALIGVAFFCLSQIMPPLRLMKAALRQGFHQTTSCVRTTMSRWAERTGFASTETEPALRFFPRADQEKGEEDDRDRQTLVFVALGHLQGPMLLSLFEHLLTSPIATNSFLNAPTMMRELRYLSGCVFVSSHLLVCLDKAYGRPVRSIEFLAGLRTDSEGPLLDWIGAVITDSLTLMEKIEMCVAVRGNLATDKAAASLMEKVRDDLQRSMESLTDRGAQSADIFKEAFESLGRTQDPLDPVPTVVHQRQLVWGLKAWCLLFQTAYIQAPLRLAGEALDRLDRLEKRTWKSALISAAGFCGGLPLLFLGLFKPFFDGCRYWIQKCHPLDDKRPKVTMAFSRWEQIKHLAFYNAHRRLRPRAMLPTPEQRQSSTHLSVCFNGDGAPQSSALITLEAGSSLRNRIRRKDGEVRVTVGLPGRGDHHHFLQHGGLWFVIRCTLGSAALFALQLYSTRWRTLNLLGRPRPSPVEILPERSVDWDYLLSTKYAPWGCLGFVTTIVETASGTFKRGLLRLTGVILGSLSGWLLLVICGRHHAWAHGLWLTLFDFLAVWISVDPSSPTNGFHPSWGYAAQLFTYQQTIIATEVYLGQSNRDELVLARLVGQAVGIGTAILVSCLVVPTRANRSIRMKAADTLHCLHESFNGLAEIIALQQDDSTANRQQLDTWTAYEEGKVRRASAHIKRARSLATDNELLVELPACLNTKPCLYRIIDGLERLVFYRELFRAFIRQLGGHGMQSTDTDAQSKPSIPLISDLISKIELMSRLLQETVNHAGRPHWPWQFANRFPIEEGEFVSLVTELSEAAFGTLEKIGALLPETTQRSIGTDLLVSLPMGASQHTFEPVPPRTTMEQMTDLNATIWIFGILELTELTWIASQMRPLLKGYRPVFTSPSDVD